MSIISSLKKTATSESTPPCSPTFNATVVTPKKVNSASSSKIFSPTLITTTVQPKQVSSFESNCKNEMLAKIISITNKIVELRKLNSASP